MNTRDRIKAIANKNGLSLPKLEEELGFGSGTIVRWDKSSPSADKLCAVADFFCVSVDSLLGREVKNTPGVHSEIEELYAAASDEDRAVIDLILSKYKSKKECQIGLGVS